MGRRVLDGDVVTSACLLACEHRGEVVEKVPLRAWQSAQRPNQLGHRRDGESVGCWWDPADVVRCQIVGQQTRSPGRSPGSGKHRWVAENWCATRPATRFILNVGRAQRHPMHSGGFTAMTTDITVTSAGRMSGGSDSRRRRVNTLARQLVVAVAAGAVAFSAVACGPADGSRGDGQDVHSGKSKPTATSAPR